MCNGVSCFEHGESQAMCQENGGRWVADDWCAEKIAMQGMEVVHMAEDGLADLAGAVWLGEYGETCCTGYEVPGQGSCDDDIDVWVSLHRLRCILMRSCSSLRSRHGDASAKSDCVDACACACRTKSCCATWTQSATRIV